MVNAINIYVSFTIQELSSGVLRSGSKYWISYQGNGTVTDNLATSENSSTARRFKTKTLEIASMTIDSDTIARYISEYRNDPKNDVIVLKCGNTKATTQSTDSNTLTSITDLIKILSIEKIIGNNDEPNSSSVVSNTEEIYWEKKDGIASSIQIFDGCTDYRYEEPTIKGLISWCSSNTQTTDQL